MKDGSKFIIDKQVQSQPLLVKVGNSIRNRPKNNFASVFKMNLKNVPAARDQERCIATHQSRCETSSSKVLFVKFRNGNNYRWKKSLHVPRLDS